jgi:hypothetical protein
MIRRLLWWLLALAPLFAAIGWAMFSAVLPEAHAAREALGDLRSTWSFADWDRADGGPLHVVARLLHLAALHVPGASVRSVVWLNVLCAVLIGSTLFSIARRSFPSAKFASGPLLIATIGLLVSSPAHGSNWLHGQRVGAFLAPLLLVVGLSWLQGQGRFVLRATGALLLAGLAPLCHANGIAVFLAMVPALLARCRSGSTISAMAWLGVLLVVGNLAAWYALRTADAFGVVGADLLHRVSSEPREMLGMLFAETGRAWLDVWPATRIDEQAIGLFSWLLPALLMIPVGRRDDAARLQAAPWWGCLWFGLAVTLVAGFRYELQPPVGTMREATYGAFLLPLGAVGLLATRFGASLLPFAAGAFAVLGVQDWHGGLEQLRIARTRAVRAVAEVAIDPQGVTRVFGSEAVQQQLVARGWIPDEAPIDARTAAVAAVPRRPEVGRSTGGRSAGGRVDQLRGTVRSSLRGVTPSWLGVVTRQGDGDPQLVAQHWPDFEGVGRDVAWRIPLDPPLTDGVRVRVVAWLPEERAFAAVGPRYVVSGGALTVDNGP